MGSSGGQPDSAITEDPAVLSNALNEIQERRAQQDSLFGASPLKSAHDVADEKKKDIDEASNLKLGLMINHLFQGLSTAFPNNDKSGMTTDLNFVGSWKLARNFLAAISRIH